MRALKTWIKADTAILFLLPAMMLVCSACVHRDVGSGLPANLCRTAHHRRFAHLFRCSLRPCAVLISWSLAICTLAYPDPRENVDRPHRRDMMRVACLVVSCLLPLHSCFVRLTRLATSVCGSRDYPLSFSPIRTLIPRAATTAQFKKTN
jgi:hypothetical protein